MLVGVAYAGTIISQLYHLTSVCYLIVECVLHFALLNSLDTMCKHLVCVRVCVHSFLNSHVHLCLASFRKAYMSGHFLHQQFVE